MFPPNPSVGDTYLNWTWNGSQWTCSPGGDGGGGTPQTGTFIGPNPPISTYAGQLWLNSTTGVLSIYDGTSWIAVGPGSGNVTVAATAPTSPSSRAATPRCRRPARWIGAKRWRAAAEPTKSPAHG